MTPEQNALLARLDGWLLSKQYNWCKIVGGIETRLTDPPDYDDERSLMPLAWKHGICHYQSPHKNSNWWAEISTQETPYKYFAEHKDPKIAIQQALLAIAREKFSE